MTDMRRQHLTLGIFLLCLLAAQGVTAASLGSFANAEGRATTLSLSGPDKHNPFFQDLGTNGRNCATCHDRRDGWSITPDTVQKRFAKSAGGDPLFRSNDGSNSPLADLESGAGAYSMLLSKAVFRIGLPIPANAEFELIGADDPYGFVSTPTAASELSLFRRPMPTANLKFITMVMWDGRESNGARTGAEDLARQANSATTGHAQGGELRENQRRRIVAFETGLFTVQTSSRDAGVLAAGAVRVPFNLAKTSFRMGMNAPFKDGTANPAFDRRVFKLFDAWRNRRDPSGDDPRAAIARGQEIFNSRPFVIRNLPGINDEAVFGQPAELTATCSTCHNVPDVGSSSLPSLFFNTGVSDQARRTDDLPLYTLRHKTNGEVLATTDPGRALVTGRWKDVGRFKVPTLRALAARPPYFHNGSAATLGDVVAFYDKRFGMALNNREWSDLVSFLSAL